MSSSSPGQHPDVAERALRAPRGRTAAWAAAAILAVNVGFLFYWGLGGTWGHEFAIGAAPPLSTAERIIAVIVGLVDLACVGVLLVRVGYWRERVPVAVARFARIGVWVVVPIALLQWNLIVAVLAFVVARSELPAPGSGAAATPSGKLGPPTPAH